MNGYGPLPGIGARDPEPEDDDGDFLDDALLCAWCDRHLKDGDAGFEPYCSEACEQEASQDRETYASVHPRPEEVG